MKRAALITLLLAVAMACGKKATKEHVPGPAPVGGLGAIPAEVSVIVTFDVTKLRQSELVRRVVAKVLDSDPADKSRLDAFLAKCKLDPAKDVDLVHLAFVKSAALLVAHGRFDEGSLVECLRGMVKEDGGSLEQKPVAGAVAYSMHGHDSTDVTWFTFVDKEVVLVAETEALLTSARDPLAPKAAGDAAAKELVRRADKSRAIWGVGRVSSEQGQNLVSATDGAVKHPPTAVTGWLDATDGASVEVALVFADATDATALADFAKEQLRNLAVMAQAVGLATVVGRIQVVASDKLVKGALALNAQELKDLEEQLEMAGEEPPPAAKPEPPKDTKEGNKP